MSDAETIELELIIVRYPSTGKSVIVKEHEAGPEIALPLSQVEVTDTMDGRNGETIGTVDVPEWLAHEKGLI